MEKRLLNKKHPKPGMIKEQVIQKPGSITLGLPELWQHRELLYYFAWRDIKVKYKHTAIGILWAIIQPLGLMLIFYFLFSKGLNVKPVSMSYPLFSLAGLTIWMFFSGSVVGAGNSMEANYRIIQKIYFPRLIIPLSSIVAALFDLLWTLLLLILLGIFVGENVNWARMFFCIPLAVAIVSAAAFGLGAAFSALSILYKYFKYALPFLIQVLFFASPVIYDASMLKSGSWWSSLLEWNPVSGSMSLFRCFLNEAPIPWESIFKSAVSSTFLLIMGIITFRKIENSMADLS